MADRAAVATPNIDEVENSIKGSAGKIEEMHLNLQTKEAEISILVSDVKSSSVRAINEIDAEKNKAKDHLENLHVVVPTNGGFEINGLIVLWDSIGIIEKLFIYGIVGAVLIFGVVVGWLVTRSTSWPR